MHWIGRGAGEVVECLTLPPPASEVRSRIIGGYICSQFITRVPKTSKHWVFIDF